LRKTEEEAVSPFFDTARIATCCHLVSQMTKKRKGGDIDLGGFCHCVWSADCAMSILPGTTCKQPSKRPRKKRSSPSFAEELWSTSSINCVPRRTPNARGHLSHEGRKHCCMVVRVACMHQQRLNAFFLSLLTQSANEEKEEGTPSEGPAQAEPSRADLRPPRPIPHQKPERFHGSTTTQH
jgi:hypothetical protein